MQQRFILELRLSNITTFVIIIVLSSSSSLCCTKYHIIDNLSLYVETLMILRSNIHTITFKTQKSNVSFKSFSIDSWWNQYSSYYIVYNMIWHVILYTIYHISFIRILFSAFSFSVVFSSSHVACRMSHIVDFHYETCNSTRQHIYYEICNSTKQRMYYEICNSTKFAIERYNVYITRFAIQQDNVLRNQRDNVLQNQRDSVLQNQRDSVNVL